MTNKSSVKIFPAKRQQIISSVNSPRSVPLCIGQIWGVLGLRKDVHETLECSAEISLAI